MTPQIQKEQIKLTDIRRKMAGRPDARRLGLVAVLICGCLIWLVPFAAAAPTVVDQYTEHVPTAGGKQESGSITRPGQPENKPGWTNVSPPSGENDHVAPSSIEEAEAPGLPASSGSKGASGSGQPAPVNSGQTAGAASQRTTDGRVEKESTLVAAVDRPEGMGIAFPLVLIGCFVFAVFAFAHSRGYVRFPKEKDVS